MNNSRRKKPLILFFVLATSILIKPDPVGAYNLTLMSQSAILIEETTGKVLYEKNADARAYPASLTKILTALTLLDYLEPQEYVVTGSEINEVPWDSSKAYHVKDETLLVENLIRGLIIPSGNETACVAAKAAAERAEGVVDMEYAHAESVFCGLMNEKAKALGAVSTNFVNPHGYHNDNHYTTARDMALIAREAMQNSLLRRIVGEREFIGNGAGESPDPAFKTQEYDWPTHNKMIIPDSEFYYSYATGMKTGFTDEAGYCFAVSAQKDGRKLLAVIMNTETEDGRWYDAKTLLEFGFNTFDDKRIQTAGEAIAEVTISNPQLGESELLELVTAEDVVRYVSDEEIERIERETEVLREALAEGTDAVRAPITKDQRVGTVRLRLDGEVLYEGALLAAADVGERTFNTDMQYYFDRFLDAAFSIKAVPYWLGGVIGMFIVIRVAVAIHQRRQRRRNPYRFVKRRRR